MRSCRGKFEHISLVIVLISNELKLTTRAVVRLTELRAPRLPAVETGG